MSRARLGRRIPAVIVLALASLVMVVAIAPAVAPTITRISGNGGSGTQGSTGPNITRNGRFVVFDSYSAILVPDDTNNVRDTFLYDTEDGSVERVSLSATAEEGNQDSYTGHASPDGRYVAFASRATNLFFGFSAGYLQVYVKDRHTGGLGLATVNLDGRPRPRLLSPERHQRRRTLRGLCLLRFRPRGRRHE